MDSLKELITDLINLSLCNVIMYFKQIKKETLTKKSKPLSYLLIFVSAIE